MLTFSGWVCATSNRSVPATAERRQFSGEPDAGNPLVRFDEGRGRHRRPRLLYRLCGLPLLRPQAALWLNVFSNFQDFYFFASSVTRAIASFRVADGAISVAFLYAFNAWSHFC
jgi:hypothetical protein